MQHVFSIAETLAAVQPQEHSEFPLPTRAAPFPKRIVLYCSVRIVFALQESFKRSAVRSRARVGLLVSPPFTEPLAITCRQCSAVLPYRWRPTAPLLCIVDGRVTRNPAMPRVCTQVHLVVVIAASEEARLVEITDSTSVRSANGEGAPVPGISNVKETSQLSFFGLHLQCRRAFRARQVATLFREIERMRAPRAHGEHVGPRRERRYQRHIPARLRHQLVVL